MTRVSKKGNSQRSSKGSLVSSGHFLNAQVTCKTLVKYYLFISYIFYSGIRVQETS